MQKGDSFDLACVVTSLLLGAGYSAVAAAGLAPIPICQNQLQAISAPQQEVLHRLGLDAIMDAHNR